jgi:hypothetical protein
MDAIRCFEVSAENENGARMKLLVKEEDWGKGADVLEVRGYYLKFRKEAVLATKNGGI